LTGVVLTTNNPKTGASIPGLGEQNLLQAVPNPTKIYQPALDKPAPLYTYVDLTFPTPVIATSYALVNCNIPANSGAKSGNVIASFHLAGSNDKCRTLVPLDKRTRIIVNNTTYFENKFPTNIVV
jgi:hypothetical protein